MTATAILARALRRRWLIVLVVVFAALPAHAEPGKVIVGTYVNKVTDVNFKDSKFGLDFYIWFRWRPVGELTDYKPLESMELINGRVDGKSSVVEKQLGDYRYASARINATISHAWDLRSFPFDGHHIQVHLEDSQYVHTGLVFEPDLENSRLGDELAVPGWKLSDFRAAVSAKTYHSNYGDISLPQGAQSTYSRLSFGMDMLRDGRGAAVKLLSTVVVATLVAFVAFGIKPSDVDPRFGLPVGALFAVAASAFVVAAAVPDSARMTVADKAHILAMAFIFASLVQSAFCLKWDEAGQEARYQRADRLSLMLFPPAFLIGMLVLVWLSLR